MNVKCIKGCNSYSLGKITKGEYYEMPEDEIKLLSRFVIVEKKPEPKKKKNVRNK